MENEFSRVVDMLPGLVWTALPDGQVDFLNQRWCEYTGHSVAEAYGQGWQTAIHAEDLPKLLERWRSILASCKPSEMEARVSVTRVPSTSEITTKLLNDTDSGDS